MKVSQRWERHESLSWKYRIHWMKKGPCKWIPWNFRTSRIKRIKLLERRTRNEEDPNLAEQDIAEQHSNICRVEKKNVLSLGFQIQTNIFRKQGLRDFIYCCSLRKFYLRISARSKKFEGPISLILHKGTSRYRV